MVLLAITPTMRKNFELSSQQCSIDHKILNNLCVQHNLNFDSVIQGSELYFEPKEIKAPTKEYTELMEKARRIIQQREYNEMIGQLENKTSNADQLQWSVIKRHLIAITNVIFSVIACFVAVFYLGELQHWDTGIRILVSMCGAFVVVIAEGWFFTKDLLNSQY